MISKGQLKGKNITGFAVAGAAEPAAACACVCRTVNLTGVARSLLAGGNTTFYQGSSSEILEVRGASVAGALRVACRSN